MAFLLIALALLCYVIWGGPLKSGDRSVRKSRIVPSNRAVRHPAGTGVPLSETPVWSALDDYQLNRLLRDSASGS